MSILSRPISYLITPGDVTQSNISKRKTELSRIAASAADEGISLIQVREKQIDGRSLLDLVRAVKLAVTGTDTLVLVNERFDIALAAGADGVHLRSDSLPVGVVRVHTPKGFLIGVSAHTLEDVRSAAGNAADFVTLGPVYSTPGKGPPIGPREFAAVCEDVRPFPVIALGGIDDQNVNEVIQAGAAGIAAIRSLNDRQVRVRILEQLR